MISVENQRVILIWLIKAVQSKMKQLKDSNIRTGPLVIELKEEDLPKFGDGITGMFKVETWLVRIAEQIKISTWRTSGVAEHKHFTREWEKSKKKYLNNFLKEIPVGKKNVDFMIDNADEP